ncbi:hypothetical protein O6P43_014242 [Quillaja saponaria]|uniref:Uncharacterized protein n=1 Tax=Quillaja saponaria TaxID=32244 RepID=A0AAD7LWJ6_QUISA|nr:hypothetical protein O6P43_014242 [Quillaja saponaria]
MDCFPDIRFCFQQHLVAPREYDCVTDYIKVLVMGIYSTGQFLGSLPLLHWKLLAWREAFCSEGDAR